MTEGEWLTTSNVRGQQAYLRWEDKWTERQVRLFAVPASAGWVSLWRGGLGSKPLRWGRRSRTA
jgi:hypothetical protein